MTTKRLAHTNIEYARGIDGKPGYGWNFYPGCLHNQTGVCPVRACWAQGMTKRIIACVKDNKSPWAIKGQYHFVLANPVLYDKPIPPEIPNWQNAPDKGGLWWLSAFCDGEYVFPRVVRIIDYGRPGRRLELEVHDNIKMAIILSEYYPDSRWCFIPEPSLDRLKAQDEEGE